MNVNKYKNIEDLSKLSDRMISEKSSRSSLAGRNVVLVKEGKSKGKSVSSIAIVKRAAQLLQKSRNGVDADVDNKTSYANLFSNVKFIEAVAEEAFEKFGSVKQLFVRISLFFNRLFFRYNSNMNSLQKVAFDPKRVVAIADLKKLGLSEKQIEDLKKTADGVGTVASARALTGLIDNVSSDGIPLKRKAEYNRCLAKVGKGEMLLNFVPIELRDEKMYLVAVGKNGLALNSVPIAMRNEKMCSVAVRNFGLALVYVPIALRNEKMCLAAIEENGLALNSVPIAMRNEKMCLAAIEKKGSMLYSVPRGGKLESFYADRRRVEIEKGSSVYELVKIGPSDEDWFLDDVKNIPSRLLDASPLVDGCLDLCRKAVGNDYHALEYVNLLLDGYTEFCKKAVGNDYHALEYVNPLMDGYADLCLDTVSNYHDALSCVPDWMKEDIKVALNISD